ncbi:hypothetical protein [Haloferax larsenii]|uniref:Uncharacterized protein n=1 Tax=Haloferax larsenii TaxID=302484 RepID=A0A1H7USU5_HALLR|nr:hypothetical protein [Haloferax larsenii]SEL99728.1 hypothetical protein SAMN04488691_11412 [Haloferax larsenii]
MTENRNQGGTDGGISRRGLFGASLAAASGIGLLSMTGSAMAQQDGTVYLRDARIGPSGSRESIGSREGWMYFETDTGNIYYDNDGSDWSKLGGGTAASGLTVIDGSGESSYSTGGSSVVYVDTSSIGQKITLTTDAASEVNGAPLEIYDIGGVAGDYPIRIEDSTGKYVTTLDVNQAYTELIYQDTQWLIKTSKGEGIWRTESDPQADITIPDSVVSRPSDNGSNPSTDNLGLKFSTSQEWPDFQARLSNNTAPITGTELVIGDTNGTDIASVDVSNKSANDVVTFNGVSLSANTSYSMFIRKANSEEVGWYDSPSFPYRSNDGNLSIDSGWADGDGTRSDYVWGIAEIGNISD